MKYKAQPAIEMLAVFGGTLAWIAALMPVVLGMPWCALHAIGLLVYGGLFGYCNWWLYYRLVCLGGDASVIGALVSTETPDAKDWPDSYDTDLSINLLLPGTVLNDKHAATQAEAEASVPFGKLVAATTTLKAHSEIKFTGEFAAPTNYPLNAAAILHAEFEGSGVWILFLTSAACLILVAIAIAVCMIPVWGWIASVILQVLAFLAMLFGHIGASGDGGSQTDVNPDLGTLNPLQGANLNIPADVLYIQGTWVFDGGHQNTGEGWNEIHPIKNAIVVGHFTGNWGMAVDTRFAGLLEHTARIDEVLVEAQSTATQGAQLKPENQWVWHPLIDGCEPRTEEPQPIR